MDVNQSRNNNSNNNNNNNNNNGNRVVFDDFLPTMAEKLGEEGFMKELCNGFRLLVDQQKGVITFESLKRNLGVLGLKGMSDEEIRAMLEEGDMDKDGCLNQMEFCVLMFRLSPGLMDGSRRWLQQALGQNCY